jgi:membrane fusion protein (multidrug efflux system)
LGLRSYLIPTQGKPKASGPKKVDTLEVDTQVLKPAPLERNLISSGTMLAEEEVVLRSEISGRIVGLFFQEGERAKKGTLLVKLQDDELKAQLQQVETALSLASEKEKRQARLLGSEAVSREEYEIAFQEQQSLLAQKALLQAKWEKTEIRAPFDGVAGLRSVSVGSFIESDDRIAAFVSVARLKIDFSLPERYFGQIQAGDALSLRIEGLDTLRTGKVLAIEPKIDPLTRMMRLRGFMENGEGRIAPGTSARVEVTLAPRLGSLLAPSHAILPGISGQTVLLFKAGLATSVPVEVLDRSKDQVQLGGVAAGDTLIVSGLMQLQPGAPVKLKQGS